jgi:hypothetical protein
MKRKLDSQVKNLSRKNIEEKLIKSLDNKGAIHKIAKQMNWEI